MKLNQYFKDNRINQREFSEKYHFTYGYIRMIANEIKVPSLKMAIRIHEATDGKVTPLDLLPQR